MSLVCVPSIFYGSAIKKGSVDLRFYHTGSLVARLTDEDSRGELREVSTAATNGQVAGVVLYDHGIMMITGSWDIIFSSDGTNTQDVNRKAKYDGGGSSIHPKWYHFGAGLYEQPLSDATTFYKQNADAHHGHGNAAGGYLLTNASYEIGFAGTNHIPSITMLAHAPKARLNYSRNPTYIDYTDPLTLSMDRHSYTESGGKIKNVNKADHHGSEANFKKQVYISKVGIYDKHNELIAIASLANPVRKTESREFTFKLKLDF
jgi:hypothetical protein